MNNFHALIIHNLGNKRFFCMWDPEIDGFTRSADWTGGWRRQSVHILTFTVNHVCDLEEHRQHSRTLITKCHL